MNLTPIAASVRHARLGPSNHRWPHCAGSVREEERYPDIAGDAAIDGTGSHELLELCLKNNVRAESYDTQVIALNHPDSPMGWLVSPDRIERVQMCLDYVTRRVRELKAEYPGGTVTVESETKSNPGGFFGRDDWWGTCDVTIMVRDEMTAECWFVEACDYKDGRMYVHVPGNTQLISYVGGKMRPFVGSGPELVRPFHLGALKASRISIVQPKSSTPVRYEDMHPMAVLDKLCEMNHAAYATDKPDAPLRAGKWCQWCKANPKRGGHCSAEADESLQTVKMMSNNVTVDGGQNIFEYIGSAVADPQGLTAEKLAELADAKPGIDAAFKKVTDEIERRVKLDPASVPGYAMESGNNKTVYSVDDETVAKKLKGRRMTKDQIFPAKLITPAALLKSKFLTPEQKVAFEKDFITSIASETKSLKKVAYVKPDPTSIFDEVPDLQSKTPVLQCNTEEAETPPPVSFF